MRYGIKSVSMDDISRELGMSKKTLYQYITDKEDLVFQSVSYHFNHDKEECDVLLEQRSNSIKQLLDLAQHITQTLGEMNPSLIYDLQKYYPKSWKQVQTHRQDYMVSCIKLNVEAGIKADLYRKDIDPDVAAKLYISLIEVSLSSPLFYDKNTNYSNIFGQIIDYHLHALMSDKGRKYLKNHIES
jgi:TetR/AcrR family transcriptional regulator, cholesterol catabolism regulator